MELEYEAWKEMNVDADEDITQADYQMAALNTRAFGYESIRDTQENKEFWVNIAALVVIVGVALVFPPAEIALGAAYGVAELTSAVSGKDWVSGRELRTGERWFRGALAVKKFSGVARTVSFADDLGQLGKTTSLTNKAQSSIQKVNDLALTAGKQATARLKQVDAMIMEREAKIVAKLADGAIGTARVVDETVVNTINLITDVIPNLRLAPADGVVQQINPHFLEDLTKGALSKFEGLNIGGKGVPKGTGNTVSDYLDDIVEAGSVNATKMNKLKNAIQNNTFSIDELSEIGKKMADLGITKEYNEALIKIDFGKYLRGLIGDPPTAMINPHAHHILFKKGLGQKQQELVREGQEILRRYGVDPIIGEENLVWAPNAVIGQHNIDALENVVNRLRTVEVEGGDFDDIVEVLEELGELASRR